MPAVHNSGPTVRLNSPDAENRRVCYGLLFRAVSETLQEIVADPRHLGAKIGILAERLQSQSRWMATDRDDQEVFTTVLGFRLTQRPLATSDAIPRRP